MINRLKVLEVVFNKEEKAYQIVDSLGFKCSVPQSISSTGKCFGERSFWFLCKMISREREWWKQCKLVYHRWARTWLNPSKHCLEPQKSPLMNSAPFILCSLNSPLFFLKNCFPRLILNVSLSSSLVFWFVAKMKPLLLLLDLVLFDHYYHYLVS